MRPRLGRPRRAARAVVPVLALALALCLASVPPARADRATRTTPVVRAVRSLSPAVVNISTTSVQRMANPFQSGDEFLDRFFREFFRPVEREQRTLGSGLIVDGRRGLIITNRHVVGQATAIRVQLADRRVFQAQVAGSDPFGDLALLKVEVKGAPLPQARLAQTDDLMIGETVIAIGNPFGLQHTVTAGVVSAVDRQVPTDDDTTLSGLIQTDASINPGNSGGPLVNVDGEVVGINTAIIQRAQGIGFAIPVGRVRRVVEDITRYGQMRPLWLGLSLQDLDARLARHFDLPAASGGALIREVAGDSPGAAAGLKRGEVILGLAGHTLEDSSHYEAIMAGLEPDQPVELEIMPAKGQRTTLTVTPRAMTPEEADHLAWRRLGLRVADLSARTSRRYGLEKGAALEAAQVRPGSPADEAGLQPGDLLLALCGMPLNDPAAFPAEVARCRHRRQISLVVQRGHNRLRLGL
ncbi:MAG: trypsin-like peptidase domain-containing protein [Deltaproteobacteria bacterium]|nr:trypsin-like peptidase domain-containing protein [Deltaproteobacteria bacterium]